MQGALCILNIFGVSRPRVRGYWGMKIGLQQSRYPISKKYFDPFFRSFVLAFVILPLSCFLTTQCMLRVGGVLLHL